MLLSPKFVKTIRSRYFQGVVGGALAFGCWWYLTSPAPPVVPAPSTPEETTLPTVLTRGVLDRTNSWFSGVYHSFPTSPLFVMPGAYQFAPAGLLLSTPNPIGTPNTVFGSFVPLCTVGNGQLVRGVTVPRYGDWDVVVEAAVTDGSTWRAHLVQGSPVVDLTGLTAGLVLDCQDDGLSQSSPHEGVVVVSRADVPLLIIQAEAPEITDSTDTLRSHSGRFRVFHWPTATDRTLEDFVRLPWTDILDTQLFVGTATQGRGDIRLQSVTADQTPFLMTVWPHHRLGETGSSVTPIFGSYATVFGRLDLIQSAELRLRPSLPNLPTEWTAVRDISQRTAIVAALKADTILKTEALPPSGVYFGGAWLGAVASLALLADTYELAAEETILLDRLELELRSRLTGFRYDEVKRMLVAVNTEFGNEKGNDHHFHYGYYIRAAAVLLAERPELRDEFVPLVSALVDDIATTNRASTRAPYLRHLDVYAGHSWADGEAHFADGNNQESTSEALNSWYALYLWYLTMDDQDRAETMRTLFAYELLGTRAYWFGEANPFPTGYEYPMASLVWGGKRDYATWFSGEAMHIHGIQWLPITPASGYLKTLPNFGLRRSELLRVHPDPAAHEWGDLYTAHLSYFAPDEAVRLLPVARQKRAMESTALLLHVVYANLERANSR